MKSVLALFFAFLATVLAHNVLLPPHGKHCFFEEVRSGDELAVSFQVGSRDPKNLEQFMIDFYVTTPNNQVVLKRTDLDHGDELIKVDTNGKYYYCFSNERSSRVDVDVSFNVHGVKYIDASDARSNTLDYAIQRLSQLTDDVRAEQSYLVMRERTHRNTAESTNDRVKWWSVFQIAVVAINSLFQIYYLKRFFEVKSVV